MDYDFFLDWELANGGKGTLQIKGGVADHPEPAAEALALIGYVNTVWSRFENHLNHFLLALNQKSGKASVLGIYKETHPTPFGDKIKMLKEHAAKHPDLASYKKQLDLLIEQAPNTADFRNTIIHAAINGYDPAARVIHMTHYKTEKRILRANSYSFPLHALEALTRDINKLNDILLSVTRNLFVTGSRGRL